MTTHHATLKAPWFQFVKDGKKTIECRLFDEKRQIVKKGDDIIFTNSFGDESIRRTVTKLRVFPTFRKALESGYIGDLLPNFNNVEDGIEAYYDIPEYKLNEKEYGVVLIYFV